LSITNRRAHVEQSGTITPKLDMLRDLNHRGITVAAEKLSAQLRMPHHSTIEGMRMTGKHVGAIDLPMQRLAVIEGHQQFTLVPWRPELLKMRGKEIEISVRATGPSRWRLRADQLGTSGCRDKSNDLRKDLGPPPACGRRPALSRWPTARATEHRVVQEASSVKKRGSRPIRVTVGRPKVQTKGAVREP
jgi:hypothetical protein